MQSENNQYQGNHSEALPPTRRQRVPLRCANCDIDVLWPPTVVEGKIFCCTGCAAGGPCNCDYSLYHSTSISGVIYYLD